MHSLPDHFGELLTAIEPLDFRAEFARQIPSQLREYLKQTPKITTVEPHSRLAGSYARQTAINNIKDVDIILVLETAYRDDSAEAALTEVFSALYNLRDCMEGVSEVTVRRKQRRSVNVLFKDSDFCIDIVPAVAPNGLTQALEIPDREWEKWVETHPLGYADELSRLNIENGSKVIPLIKMMKYWRDVHMIMRRPKSYWLECLVYHIICNGEVSTSGIGYGELFSKVLGAIYSNYASYLEKETVPSISDPMLGNNVAHNWERSGFETFMARILESYNWSQRALDAATEQNAVELWIKVFGEEKFPSNFAQIKGRALKRAQVAGSIYVSPNLGHVSTVRPTGQSIKLAPQRFYGDANE